MDTEKAKAAAPPTAPAPLDKLPVGRPDKLTAEVHLWIVQAVRETVDVVVAAGARNISRSTLDRWRRRAKRYNTDPSKYSRWQKYAKFWSDVKAAEDFSEVALVNLIRKSAQDGSTADAKWLLERRHKRRWQPSQITEHTGGGGEGPVEFVLATPKPRAMDADHFGDDEAKEG